MWLAQDLLERSRISLGVAIEETLPQEEQAHGAQVAIAMATAAQAHATLAALPETMVALRDGMDVANAQLDAMRRTVAGHVAEALVSPVPQVRRWAQSIATELDAVGCNIDRQVEERSKDLGVGPCLWTAHGGVQFNLHRQYMDQHGKRWEHSGDWTQLIVPVMARDDKPNRLLPLDELINQRGPLMEAESRPSKKRTALGYSDEPPF